MIWRNVSQGQLRLKLVSFTRFHLLSCLLLFLYCNLQLLLNILFNSFHIHILRLPFLSSTIDLYYSKESAGKDQFKARHCNQGNKWSNITFKFRTFEQLTVTILLFKPPCYNYKNQHDEKKMLSLAQSVTLEQFVKSWIFCRLIMPVHQNANWLILWRV